MLLRWFLKWHRHNHRDILVGKFDNLLDCVKIWWGMTKMPDHAIMPCLVCEPVSEAGFTYPLIVSESPWPSSLTFDTQKSPKVQHLTHCGLMMTYSHLDLGQQWFMASYLMAPSHYLNQCWLIVKDVSHWGRVMHNMWVNWPPLVQIMACRLASAKPLPEPMIKYCYFYPWGQT